MKKRRIQYNELSEEIYESPFWTLPKLVFVSVLIAFVGFLVNFSLEERINKLLQAKLSSNASCPIQFERAELSYFLPSLTLKKPVILGACFGQYRNRLDFKDIKIGFHSPSFYPIGLRLHIEAHTGKSFLNLYPVISIFTQSVKIEKTVIDSQLFGVMSQNGISMVSGTLSLEGFFEFQGNQIVDGELDIVSKNFSLPAQNIKGFELSRINLQTLKVSAKFIEPGVLEISNLNIGSAQAPVEIKLVGNLKLNQNDIMTSVLSLDGKLRLSEAMLLNFSFLKLFLPENNTSGSYQLKLTGPLRNLGPPQIK
jgi:hypothetical protein